MSKGANGTGTVYKPKHPSKNLPFRAEVWITDFSHSDGKRRVSKNFKKRTEAEKWRDDMLSKYGKTDNSVCNPMITLSEWLTFWLKNFTPKIKDSTRTGYECYIEQHISKHRIGKIKLKDLNVCDLQSYVSYLTSSGNLKNDSGLSTKTIRSMMLMIKKSLHAAVGADIINKNPAEYIILPKLQQKPVEYLTLEQVKKLINISRGERWEIFFPLAFISACRIVELGALRRSSLKPKTEYIIFQSKVLSIVRKTFQVNRIHELFSVSVQPRIQNHVRYQYPKNLLSCCINIFRNRTKKLQ